MKIRSRPIESGHEKESTWPPPQGKGGKGIYHRNEKGEWVEGVPPYKYNYFGQAPGFISDSIKPFYHHGACKVVESRSELRAIDKACGTITTDKPITSSEGRDAERKAKQLADIDAATERAAWAVANGQSPLSEEQRRDCKIQDEIIKQKTGIDVSSWGLKGRKKK